MRDRKTAEAMLDGAIVAAIWADRLKGNPRGERKQIEANRKRAAVLDAMTVPDELARRIERVLESAHDSAEYAKQKGHPLYDPYDQWQACIEVLQAVHAMLAAPQKEDKPWRSSR